MGQMLNGTMANPGHGGEGSLCGLYGTWEEETNHIGAPGQQGGTEKLSWELPDRR